MKKALFPLALTLSLVTPLAHAGRINTTTSEPATFAPQDLHSAFDTAEMAGLERPGYRTLVVGAAVPGTVTGLCQATLVGARGVVLERASFEVEAGSSAQVDFADRMGLRMAAGAKVSCNQPFYAYGAAAAPDQPKVVWAEGIGPNAACNFTISATEVEPGFFVANQDGTIHTVVKGKEKGVVCIKVPKDLPLSKLVLEWDVTPGPWHTRVPSGNHAMMFLHRGRFRSNTVANVNAFGPKKSFVKMNQNVDLAASKNTNQKLGYELKPNTIYNIRYTYDAANKRVTTELYQNGALIKSASMEGTARNRVLSVLAKGLTDKGSLFAEFGHFAGQHPPEMPSYGWRYANMRVEMTVKK